MIELLLVISIIALLSSIVLVANNRVRAKSKIARVQSDLINIRNAMAFMANDTGKWPNGCTLDYILAPDEGLSNEVMLDDPKSGLLVRPPVGVTDSSAKCEWTAADVNAWNGPYMQASQVMDPWGTPYWFDNDSEAFRDCPSYTEPLITAAVIQSLGPNKTGGALTAVYDCDDVYAYIYF